MSKYIVYLVIMAGVTYLIRMLPITLFQKEIHNIYIKSFLYYVPYAVLAAMSFPAMLSCTGNIVASSIATLVALLLAYFERGLLQVAIGACLCAYIVALFV